MKLILPILKELKARTGDLHLEIEQVPLLARLMERAADDDYRALLWRMWGFYRPLETRLSAVDWKTAGLDFETRRKCELLAADLESLGVSDSELASGPFCEALPECADLSSALGCLYVLEGATLGGQVLRKAVTAHGPRPVRFFNGYGADTGARWNEFREKLSAHVALQGESEKVIGSARETFSRLQSWLESRGENAE